MKHFQITGPKSNTEIDIEDDEMIEWRIVKIADWIKAKKQEPDKCGGCKNKCGCKKKILPLDDGEG